MRYLIFPLLIGVVFSGCIGMEIPVNQSKMADQELINNFCQINEFDRGITETQDPMAFYVYWRDHDVSGIKTNPLKNSYEQFPRKIICVKIETKETNMGFDYNELYRWIKND